MMGYGYGYGYPMAGYGGFGVLHAVASIFWIVVLVALVVMTVRFFRGKPMLKCKDWCHLCGGNHALDTLRERYAKGEIDKVEFEEKKKDLSA